MANSYIDIINVGNTDVDLHDKRIAGIDSTPTSSSSNPVTSGGVYSALAGKADTSDIPDAVTANPTVPSGTTPTPLTRLQVGSGYYSIDGAVSDVTVGGTSVVSNGVAAVPAIPDVTGKADKVSGATNGHLAGLDSNGNLTDSGKSASDFQPTIDSTHKLPYSLISDTPTIPTVTSMAAADIATAVDTAWNAVMS